MWFPDRGPGSLVKRLGSRLAAGIIAVATLGFLGLQLVIGRELKAHADRDLALREEAIATFAATHPGSESVGDFMGRFRAGAHEDFFEIWAEDGRLLSRSDSSGTSVLDHPKGIGTTPVFYDTALPDGHRGRAIAAYFPLPDGDPRGALLVVTAEETETFVALGRLVTITLLLASGVTLLVLLPITRAVVRRTLRPIGEFAQRLERVNPDSLQEPPVERSLPLELQPLAASFSALLKRLMDALDREKRYARHLAHELRNPLAALRLLADVGTEARDPEAMRAAIRDIGATAAELQQVVESLLALTRFEAGLERPELEPVDLGTELRRQVAAAGAMALKPGVAIDLDTPAEWWAYTDPLLLHRLVGILITNAVTYAPPDSRVVVALRADGSLQMANPAPHLVPEDIPRLGERFVRIDGGDRGTHAGLGLSLAFAIARVLQLHLELALDAKGWFNATITGFRTLPAAPEASPLAGSPSGPESAHRAPERPA
ncbi:MAG: hypothetical protein JSR54_11675 [Proteobacteria bacterium]|nr:hypothetical protein [Pseudomonadota bacterium]